MFSDQELDRYSRQIKLENFGTENQSRLKNSSVLVIGAGGLGCPLLQYLAAAGTGNITIADPDVVSLSNLHRQILFTTKDIGKNKSETAALRLKEMNPEISINCVQERITQKNILHLLSDHDLIIDATDNFESRYLINDACVLQGKPLLSGSVFRWQGQVMILNVLQPDGTRSINYRDVYPENGAMTQPINCEDTGVMGVAAGMTGLQMCIEAINFITGQYNPDAGELTFMDLTTGKQQRIKIPVPLKRQFPPSTEEEFKKRQYGAHVCTTASSISPEELNSMLRTNDKLVVIDVRMDMEMPEAESISNINIPLPLLEQRSSELQNFDTMVTFCNTEKRSLMALDILRKQFPEKNIFSLEKGIENWNNYISNPERQKD